MGTPLSGYAKRFVGAKGEPGNRGSTGVNGVDGTVFNTCIYSAYPSGGQIGATRLMSMDCLVSDVATANDSVMLKLAIVDERQIVRNATSTDLAIYPQIGQNIFGQAINAPYVLGGDQAIEFVCFENGEFRF
jgi:hypothetical protein